MRLAVGTATHVGRIRAVNEDSVVASTTLVAVADGMGGHAAGDVASRCAVAHLQALAEQAEAVQPERLLETLNDANSDIVRTAEAHAEQAGMGTTISGLAVVVVGGIEHWMVFNIGDSRVYRLNEEGLLQVSVDHSEVQELVDSGQLTPIQARDYPRRNVVTRSLGTEPAPQPDVWVFPPVDGDRFLICSDGLTLELSDEAICELLRSEPDSQTVADRLVAAAVNAGGHDNVTAVVVDLLSDDEHNTVEVDTAPRANLLDGSK
jgi:PPM family protein phosphatase